MLRERGRGLAGVATNALHQQVTDEGCMSWDVSALWGTCKMCPWWPAVLMGRWQLHLRFAAVPVQSAAQ